MGFDRRGKPRKAMIIGTETGSGYRFLANYGDEMTLNKLCNTGLDPVGMCDYVKVQADGKTSSLSAWMAGCEAQTCHVRSVVVVRTVTI